MATHASTTTLSRDPAAVDLVLSRRSEREDPEFRALATSARTGLAGPPPVPHRRQHERSRVWPIVVALPLVCALVVLRVISLAPHDAPAEPSTDERAKLAVEPDLEARDRFFVPTVNGPLDDESRDEASREMARSRRNALKAALACTGTSPAHRPVVAPELPGVVGGSAGLILALALVDDLVPADLTAGRVIAATGTIDAKGNVGPVGSVPAKVAASERAGAEILLVPAEQADEAAASADTIKVKGVRTLDEAVRVLSGAGCRRS